jgi:RHS repeat-associated protein
VLTRRRFENTAARKKESTKNQLRIFSRALRRKANMLTRRDFGKGAALTALVSTARLSGQAQSTSSPAESTSPRRVGLRHNGIYWGHSPEKIDLLSGNLNLTLPLLHAQSRGVAAVAALSYNSQVSVDNSLGGQTKATDLGVGFGWAIRVASILPVTEDGTTAGYTYIDAHGSEYALTRSGNVWVSLNGSYLTFDPASASLKEASGKTLVFGCTSSAEEPDAGTLHPTLIQDTNGNQIKIQYAAGSRSLTINTSSRINSISDARASTTNSGVTFSFRYSSEHMPRLLSIVSNLPTNESYNFSYVQRSVSSPFAQEGETKASTALASITNAAGESTSFSYNNYGEITSAVLADGGVLSWEYSTVRFGNGASVREVSSRTAQSSAEAITQKQSFSRSSLDQDVHSTAVLTEANQTSRRVWTFTADSSSPDCGLLASLTSYSGERPLRQESFSWGRTGAGAPYICLHTKVLDPGSSAQQTSRITSTRDTYGNLLTHTTYDYDNPGTPAKTVACTYLSDPDYIQQHILNRVTSKKITDRQDSVNLTQTNYDSSPISDTDAVTHHDTARFSSAFTLRGNSSEHIVRGISHIVHRDQTGIVTRIDDGSGSSVTFAPAPGTNNTKIGTTIVNGDESRATITAYNTAGLAVAQTGANGFHLEKTYDALGRTTSITNRSGSITTIAYGVSPTTVTRTVNGRWTKQTKDGFGRVVTIERGDSNGTQTLSQMQYAAVPHTTAGALIRHSLPSAPDGPVTWINRQYDDLGRLAAHDSPSSSGLQTIQHAGNTKLVTDGAGKWKRLTHNAEGKLVKVTLPAPDGGADHETHYTYDTFGNLSSVAMPRAVGTQRRKFKYNSNGKPVLVQHAESGPQHMTYASDGTLATRTDAKGQKEVYQRDTFKRVTSITRFNAQGVQQPNESFTYSFDRNPYDSGFSQNVTGRLAAVRWGSPGTLPGLVTEMYSYNTNGQITAVRLRVNRGQNDLDLDLTSVYDEQGQLQMLNYPGGGPSVQHTYDSNGYLVGVSTSTDVVAKDATYDVTGKLTGLKLLASSDGQYMTENRTYDSRNRLTRIATGAEDNNATNTVVPKVDLIYDYRDSDGLLQAETDNVQGVSTSYTYDIQNRIAGALSSDGDWGLAFTYDGFGNRVSQSVVQGQGYSQTLQHDPATNWILDNDAAYDANGNIVSLPYLRISYDTMNRITAIKSLAAGAESYGYNHRNMRMYTNTEQKGEQLYFYAGNKVLALYGLSTDSSGNLVASLKSSNIYFGDRIVKSRGDAVVIDRLGATRAWSSKAGAKVTKYLPFGEELKQTNEGIAKFGGYQRDATGLDYAQNRYYNSSIGRFMTPDPYKRTSASSNPNSWNRYAFVKNNPVNRIDSDGLNDQSTQSSGSYSSTSVTGTSSDGTTWSVDQTGQTDANGNQIINMTITAPADPTVQVQTTATPSTGQLQAVEDGGLLSMSIGGITASNSVAIGYYGAATFQELSGIVVSSEALDAVIFVTASTGWGLVAIGAVVAGVAIWDLAHSK